MIPFIQSQLEAELKALMSDQVCNKANFILENNKYLFHIFSTKHLRLKVYENKCKYNPSIKFEITRMKNKLIKITFTHILLLHIYYFFLNFIYY